MFSYAEVEGGAAAAAAAAGEMRVEDKTQVLLLNAAKEIFDIILDPPDATYQV